MTKITHTLIYGLTAICLCGCNRSPTETTPEHKDSGIKNAEPPAPKATLVGRWHLEGKTKKGTPITSDEELRADGTFTIKGMAQYPTGWKPYVQSGVWRADETHFYNTITSSHPPGKEMTNTLISVSDTEYSIRSEDGKVRTSQRVK